MFKTRGDAAITSHLLKYQLKWHSAAQVFGTSDPAAVLLQTLVHIYRDARVQAAVSAAQNIETVISSAHLCFAVNALVGRRIFFQQHRWPNGSRNEISAAIRTDAVQSRRNAAAAKSAFERTDHRIRRIGRKITIARFAIGAELKHSAGCQALPPVSASPRTRKAPASILARFSGVSA